MHTLVVSAAIIEMRATELVEEGFGTEPSEIAGRWSLRQSNLLIRLLLVVVFSGGYLALAVFGRGGIAALFAQPALIALTVVLAALSGTAFVAGVGGTTERARSVNRQ